MTYKFDWKDIGYLTIDCDYEDYAEPDKESCELIADLLNELQDIMADVNRQGFETPEINKKFNRLMEKI